MRFVRINDESPTLHASDIVIHYNVVVAHGNTPAETKAAYQSLGSNGMDQKDRPILAWLLCSQVSEKIESQGSWPWYVPPF